MHNMSLLGQPEDVYNYTGFKEYLYAYKDGHCRKPALYAVKESIQGTENGSSYYKQVVSGYASDISDKNIICPHCHKFKNNSDERKYKTNGKEQQNIDCNVYHAEYYQTYPTYDIDLPELKMQYYLAKEDDSKKPIENKTKEENEAIKPKIKKKASFKVESSSDESNLSYIRPISKNNSDSYSNYIEFEKNDPSDFPTENSLNNAINNTGHGQDSNFNINLKNKATSVDDMQNKLTTYVQTSNSYNKNENSTQFENMDLNFINSGSSNSTDSNSLSNNNSEDIQIEGNDIYSDSKNIRSKSTQYEEATAERIVSNDSLSSNISDENTNYASYNAPIPKVSSELQKTEHPRNMTETINVGPGSPFNYKNMAINEENITYKETNYKTQIIQSSINEPNKDKIATKRKNDNKSSKSNTDSSPLEYNKSKKDKHRHKEKHHSNESNKYIREKNVHKAEPQLQSKNYSMPLPEVFNIDCQPFNMQSVNRLNDCQCRTCKGCNSVSTNDSSSSNAKHLNSIASSSLSRSGSRLTSSDITSLEYCDSKCFSPSRHSCIKRTRFCLSDPKYCCDNTGRCNFHKRNYNKKCCSQKRIKFDCSNYRDPENCSDLRLAFDKKRTRKSKAEPIDPSKYFAGPQNMFQQFTCRLKNYYGNIKKKMFKNADNYSE